VSIRRPPHTCDEKRTGRCVHVKIEKLRNLGIFYKIMGISAIAIVVIILWNILYLLPQMERIMLKEKQNAVKDVVDVAYSMLNDYDKRVKVNDIEMGMAQMAAIKSIQQLRYRARITSGSTTRSPR
jgi:methyl-accepting chemotaxis protein